MVVAAADFDMDAQSLHRAMYDGVHNPTAFNRVLNETELNVPGFIRGSGGSVTVYIDQSPSGSDVLIDIARGNSLTKAIEKIIQTFALTKDELARILAVQSRKTIYNWLNGTSTPRKAVLDRIHTLQMTANEWKRSGLPSPKGQLHIPLTEGQSIFALLQQGASKELLLFAGSRLQQQQAFVSSLPDPFA